MAADIGVGVARKRRDLQRFAVGLLQSDNVGIGLLDRLDDPVEINLIAAIPDIETHDLDLDGFSRRRGSREKDGKERTKNECAA